MDIPSRALSNVRYNKSKRFIEMGRNTNRRELFNLSQAKSYMQTMLVASGCKQLIEEGKTTSIRGLYYLLKHTIEGPRKRRSPIRPSAIRSSRTSKSCSTPPRGTAPVRPETGRHGRANRHCSTAATRSTARGWARAATAFRRSSSRT
jgi:hypothetical protein